MARLRWSQTCARVELTTDVVQGWVATLSARVAPTTVPRTYTVLAQLVDAAVGTGILAANPTSRIRLLRVERYEARFLIPAELEHLADTIRPPWKAVMLTMAYATLRIGEAAGLRRGDLDLTHRRLRVANNLVVVHGRVMEDPPKTSAGRRAMTLRASVVSDIQDHLDRFAGDPYVLTAPRGGSIHPGTWRHAIWAPAVPKAPGLPRYASTA